MKSVIREKQTESSNAISRLKNGLDKIIEANIKVGEMQVELSAKQPLLEVASKETEKMMAIIEVESAAASEK